jgi:AraC-like DNA-binding protein
LTAKTEQEEQIEGFKSGADDYITKPFSFEILESRIRNLILLRESLRKTFQKHIEVGPSEVIVDSIDEKLILKALEIVEKNMANADFSVEELSHELGMSRVHLYKKLLSLTGKTPIEFIRTIRLKRAAQLLKSKSMSISEIAFKVGFNNPKYFSKYFKDEFNVLPSQYILNLEDQKKL